MSTKKYLDDTGLSYFWSKLKTLFNGKQDALVSGTNIKTINNESVVGSGNIDLSDVIPNETNPATVIKTNKKWINGKPIYRQTLVYGSRSAGASINYALSNFADLDEVVGLYGHMKSSSFKNVPLNYFYHGTTDYNNALYCTGTVITCYTSIGWSNAYIIIEYTKTTD